MSNKTDEQDAKGAQAPFDVARAVAEAAPGDTVAVPAGTYDAPLIRGAAFDPSDPVTIAPAGDGPVRFEGTTKIKDSSGLVLTGIEFQADIGAERAGRGGTSYLDARDLAAVRVQGSSDIVLADNVVEGGTLAPGDVSGGAQTYVGKNVGIGVLLRDSDRVEIADSAMSDLGKGVVLDRTQDVTIRGNRIEDTREDVIRGANHDGTTVEGNVMIELSPWRANPGQVESRTDEHADFVQFWTTPGGTGISDFTITGNVMIDREGTAQGVFGWNKHEGGGNQFRDFTVSDNLIYSGHRHGINLNDVRGGIVEGNTLVPNAEMPRGAVAVPIVEIGGGSSGIRVANNLVPDRNGDAVTVDDRARGIEGSGNVGYLVGADARGAPEGALTRGTVFGDLAGSGPVTAADLGVTSPGVPAGVGSTLGGASVWMGAEAPSDPDEFVFAPAGEDAPDETPEPDRPVAEGPGPAEVEPEADPAADPIAAEPDASDSPPL